MLHKKLAMHFLEIQYSILKNFKPSSIVNSKQSRQEAIKALSYEEQAKKR